VKPVDVQTVGEDLAIKWDDGSETYIKLELLRRACPCAGCKGEMDVMGNLHKGPEQNLSAKSFILQQVVKIGGYAMQPTWADGHATGLYTYDYLRRIAG